MKVIVCYKVVYEEQDISVKADGTLSFDRAEQKLSMYDLNAIEEGVRLVEGGEGLVSALSVGGRLLDNSKLRKGVLSRGTHQLYLVKDNALEDADTHQTARILAAAAEKIGFDLILCGEGSADVYAQQVGMQLGEILKLPVVNCVSKITVKGDRLEVERTLEETVEVLEVSLPAVVCVTSDINEPRLPGMKDILAAGKKPVTEWSCHDLGIPLPEPTVTVAGVSAPKQADRRKIIVESVEEFFEKIKNEIK